MAATVNVNGRVVRSGARGHLGLRSRLPLRRGRLRDAADLQRPAVPVRAPHAAAAQVGRHAGAAVPLTDARDRRAASATRCARPAWATAPAREAYIRILVTRGIGELTYDPGRLPRRRRSSSSSSRTSIRRAEAFERGVKVALVGDRPQPSRIGEPADQVEQPAEQRAGDAGGAAARRASKA